MKRFTLPSIALLGIACSGLTLQGVADDSTGDASREVIDAPPSASLSSVTNDQRASRDTTVDGDATNVRTRGHGLGRVSLFYVPPEEPRVFAMHDLVQIIVRESSQTSSEQQVDLSKDYDLSGGISAFPDLQLARLLQFQLQNSNSDNLPRVGVDFKKEFSGDGEYERSDDFSTRITAEVIEVLPNGNLVLEARTTIQTDTEVNTIQVTGVCRQDDITAANTVLSNQVHDLIVRKMHEGELKKANEKGIIAQVLDTIFAF
jgi:flagellar L-ring protein precursor FlgH